jgi:hypothetical protein
LILQNVLGHPSHLPSLAELDHMLPKSKAAISDQLQTLIDADVLAEYVHEPSESKRDLPAKFYGLTPHGVEILSEYNYLSGLPIARSVYDNTRKSAQVERHENAPRPRLPEQVERMLSTEKTRE